MRYVRKLDLDHLDLAAEFLLAAAYILSALMTDAETAMSVSYVMVGTIHMCHHVSTAHRNREKGHSTE